MTDTLFDIKALIESNKILRGKLKEAQRRIDELEGKMTPVMKRNVISHDFTKKAFQKSKINKSGDFGSGT